MTADCLFCKILAREVPAEIVYEDDDVLAFNDIYPKAPFHVLIIPKKHIATMNEVTDEDRLLVGTLHHTAAKLAGDLGIADAGYRLVCNTNPGAGQTVFHIHVHLLGGRPMTWPPG